MKIVDFENTKESREAFAFYKKMRIKKDDLYCDSWKCGAFKGFKVVLDFDSENKERGLLIKSETKND